MRRASTFLFQMLKVVFLSIFNVRRTLLLSCTASHTSRRVRTWRVTMPTTTKNLPAQLPHFLSWATGGLATGIARAFPQTFPGLRASTARSRALFPLSILRARTGASCDLWRTVSCAESICILCNCKSDLADWKRSHANFVFSLHSLFSSSPLFNPLIVLSLL